MKTALIFGVSGQDGAYLSQFLLNKGYRVIGTSRDVHSASFKNLDALGIRDNIQLLSVSLYEFRSVLQAINSTKPDEIYNLAGQTSVRLSFDQPVEAFESISIANLNILEAIRFLKIPTRYYNAGSSECFGNTNGKAATEDLPFHPRSPYATAKAAAFWQLANYREAYHLFACSGILFNHESPLRPDHFVTQKIVSGACRINKGQQKLLNLGNISVERDWGWAPEYVESMWLMLQQQNCEDFLIATGESNTLESFIEAVFSYMNMDWRDHVKCDQTLWRPTDINSIRANPSKAELQLGWKAKYKMKDVAQMMVEHELSSK
ncbi:MAG: GDP-mannose 4,6-dehydratase [Desulfobacterales bacterium]|nr:GDP-mannose 4,6-dehydratase [Desulfobacterales bacterium]